MAIVFAVRFRVEKNASTTLKVNPIAGRTRHEPSDWQRFRAAHIL